MEKSIFPHLALPQQLPQHEDRNLDAVEANLLHRLTAASLVMRGVEGHYASFIWGVIHNFLSEATHINDGGKVDRLTLRSTLASLPEPGACLVYIRSQNAAILIHRHPRSVCFCDTEPLRLCPSDCHKLAQPSIL